MGFHVYTILKDQKLKRALQAAVLEAKDAGRLADRVTIRIRATGRHTTPYSDSFFPRIRT